MKGNAYKSSYVRSILCERKLSCERHTAKPNSGRYCEIRNIRIKSGGMYYFLKVLENIDAHMNCTGPVELHSYPESPNRA